MIDIEKLIKNRIKFNKKELRKTEKVCAAPYDANAPTGQTLRNILMYHKGAIKELEILLEEVKLERKNLNVWFPNEEI
jgi:hypothetical protein